MIFAKQNLAYFMLLAVMAFALSGCPDRSAVDEGANVAEQVPEDAVVTDESASDAPVDGDMDPSTDPPSARTFLGQDGRERVVPTGPPPTDADGRLELTFDDLSFEMEKGGDFDRSMLTERINSFDGAEVRLRGFIRPSFRQSNIEKFVFVRDNQECCFGPGAAIYDNALVTLAKGTDTQYTTRPIVVAGKLALKEYKTPDGMVLSIYRIRKARVE